MNNDFNRMNHYANQSKLSNLFLGFFEGLFLDDRVNQKEIEALIKWVETYPECCDLPHFDTLYNLLVKAAQEPDFLLSSSKEITEVIQALKSSQHFVAGTADIQRLHGLLAGLICDQNIYNDEVIALNHWLNNHSHLETDPIYQEILTVLNPVRLLNRVSEDSKELLKLTLDKYVQLDNFGLPKLVVTSTEEHKNPDFYHGEFAISGNTFCLTGASARYSKAEWKQLIESKSGIFKDDLTKAVNYLVICNKGNPHWAHMSYGRKFEQALKWQKDGLNIRILTEDNFVNVLNGEE